jgi:hypothetical protein
VTANPVAEGRAYLYNFDFIQFRQNAEETIRPFNHFLCQGICWKFRFAGSLALWVNGRIVITLQVDAGPDSYPFTVPFRVRPEDEICIQVTDTQRRWFRWFRPNTAYVVLEGLEYEA